jgi:multiple sugar transport system substrate-binding protein
MDDDRILSIPWMTDTRLVFYWRDALEKARVDEQYAFDSPLQMEEALQRIVDSGQPALAIPTFGVTNAIHQLASWLWAMGGSFLSPDGRTAEFLSADSFAGICAYFRLHRFMARRYNSLDAVTDAFEAKNAAVTVNGPWFLKSMILRGATPQDLENLGVALPPGPPFLGGSNLVIWQRVKEESIDAALSWVAHLTSPSVQREVCNTTGLMPVLSDALNEPPYSTDAHYSVFKKAIERGQTLPRIARWGSLEEELVRAVGNIWSDLNEDPRLEVNATVRHYLTPVARHFDRVLNNK